MLADELKSIVQGEVAADAETLKSHSTDASVFEVTPEAVVYPRDTADLKQLVKWASAKRERRELVSLTARAAGTCMSGGSLTDSVSLDFTKHFNRIKLAENHQIIVEPGVYYRDLEKVLDEKNLFLPSYPASKNICAVGGMVANNAAGEKTLQYGQTDRYVKALKVVLADGEEYAVKQLDRQALDEKLRQENFEGKVYRGVAKLLEDNAALLQETKPKTSKNAAGYNLWQIWDGERKIFDLTKLFVGSQGTLGLISEITFQVVAKKPYSRFAVVFLPDLSRLVELVQTVLNYQPESFECYDDETFNLAIQAMTYQIKILADAWGPLLEMIKGNMPKLVLLIELAGANERELEDRFLHLMSDLSIYNVPVRVVGSSVEAEKYWLIRHESFNLLRKHYHAATAESAPFIDDIIVRPETLKDFLPALRTTLDRYRDHFTYTIAGHIGDGNFHIIPIANLADPETRRLIPQMMDEVFKLVWQYGGSDSAEHNDGLIRGHYLKQQFGEKVFGLFADIKTLFDPLDIFNPHKKTNADWQYSAAHLKTQAS